VAPELAAGAETFTGSFSDHGAGATPPDASVDVYSYGILLFALTTCEEPYRELRRVQPQQLMALVVGGYRPLSHSMQVADGQQLAAAAPMGSLAAAGAADGSGSGGGGAEGSYRSSGSGGILLSPPPPSSPSSSLPSALNGQPLLTSAAFSVASSSSYETLSGCAMQVPMLGSPQERLAAAARAASGGRDVSPLLLNLMVRSRAEFESTRHA